MSHNVPSSRMYSLIPAWLKGIWGSLGIIFIVYTLLNIAWTYFHWGGPQHITLLANLLSFVPSVLASVLAWRIASQSSLNKSLRRAWLILGISFFMFLIGNLIWAYLEVILQVEPFPSLADVFYLAFYPLALWGVWSMPSVAQNRREHLTFWLDMLNVLTAAAMFVGYFIIIPTAATSSNDLLTKIIAPAYPIGSLLLIGGILALLYRRISADTQSALSLLFIGMLFFVGGDIGFGYTSLIGTYTPGGWTDASWNIAQLFFGLAALRGLAPTLPSTFTKRWKPLRQRITLWLPWIAVPLSYGLVFYVNVVKTEVQASWLVVCALLLFVFLIARQISAPSFINISLHAKLILAFLLVSGLSISLVTFFTYLNLRSNVEAAVGSHLKAQAEIQAQAVGNLLSKQSDIIEGLVLVESVRESVLQANAEYTGDLHNINEKLPDQDLPSMSLENNDELIQDILQNQTAHKLHEFLANFPGFTDLLITDQYGATISATSRPEYYFHANEEWWQAAWAGGQGTIFIGQPTSVPKSLTRSMIIAMPIRSSTGGKVIGIVRALYDPQDMIEILNTTRRDMYDDLLLPDGRLFNHDGLILSLDPSTLSRLRQTSEMNYVQLNLERALSLVSQAQVTSPDLEEVQAFENLNWTIIVHQDAIDALAAVNAAWRTASLTIIIVLILAVGAAVALAQLFVAPISRLTKVTEQIAAGNFSAKANVESRDEIGILASTFNSMLDVLSHTQQELQENETHYRTLVNYSPDMIAVHSAGKYVFINPAGANLLGAKSASDLIGKNILDLIPEQAREFVRQRIESITNSGEPTPVAYQQMYRLDGTSFNAEYRAIPFTYAGQPAIELVARDITERKKAEEQIHRLLTEVALQKRDLEIRVDERTEELKTLNERLQKELNERQQLMGSLRDSEERFRLLFDASPDAIFLIDPHSPDPLWQIIDCNLAAGLMNGYTREELIGQSIDILNQKKGSREDFCLSLENLRRETVLYGVEVCHIRKGGQVFPIEYSTTLIKVGDRELVLGIDRDVTERKQSELLLCQAKDTAETASRAKSEFLSRMSHELRTPMNAILGFAQLLDMSRKEPLTQQQKERVRQIVKGGQHLLDLINEILDISRIEANRLQISPEPVAIQDSLQDVIDLIIPLAIKRQIQVVSKVGNLNAQPYVMADRQRFKQILLNLLGNAVKYNYESGSVVIRCEQTPASRWRISITDTGPGISQENIARLFTPFERLDTNQPYVEGTGLGLVLAKRLIELMHGQIGVQSMLGRGSTFWIELPAAEHPVARLQRMGVTKELSPLAVNAHTILYVEDNVANYELIQQVLVDYSHIDLLWAADFKSGVELAHRRHPDLILLDLHLGDENGMEILKHLKQDEQTAEIPVVVVSADATSGQDQRSKSFGAYAYLTKPLDVKQFVRLVEEVLGEKER